MEFSTLPDTLRTSPAMSACPISVLSAVTTPTNTTPRAVTEDEQGGLLHALSAVPDPRTARGMRYPLAGLLTVAVCAVMAGASSFAAITDRLHDLDDIARARLGFIRKVPAATTIWRLLTRLDADHLATVLAGWLRTRVRPPAGPRPRRHRIVIAVDGKTMRGARRPDGTKVHLLSALDTSTGIVLAQITVAAKSNEIPAFTPLLDAVEHVLGSLHGVVFVADALHTQTSHATELAARGAHLLIPTKGNQPTVFAKLKALPWAEVPVGDRRRETGHGRRETRTVKAVTVTTPGRPALPPRPASRPDHPNPHHQRQNHPGNRLLHRLPTSRARPTRGPAGLGPPRVADRKLDPSRPRRHLP